MEHNYKYKDSYYDIIGFCVSKREIENYKFKYILGNKDDLRWAFNINGTLIGCNSYGNYPLDGYSAVVIDDYFYILSDFDLYKINLMNLECELHIELDDYYPMDEIYKFYNGVVLIGEAQIVYVENDKIKWNYYNHDNFIYYATVCTDNTIDVSIEQIDGYNFRVTLNKDGKEI